jgi:hypothetical protein
MNQGHYPGSTVECAAPRILIALVMLTTAVFPAQAQERARPKAGVPSESAAMPLKVAAPAVEQDDEVVPSEEVLGQRDGTIVRMDRDLLFFDVGSERGVAVGQPIAILRTITAKHPVTGQSLVDYFPLGTLRVEGVGSVLSFGRAERRIAPLVKVGDVVRIVPVPKPERPRGTGKLAAHAKEPASEPASPVKPALAAAPAATPVNSADAEAQRLFHSTLGRPLGERVKLIETFLATHKDTPFRATFDGELSQLRLIRETMERAVSLISQRAAAGARPDEVSRKWAPVASLALPGRLYEGAPVELAVYVANPQVVRSCWVYLRRQPERTYARIALTAEGDGYFRMRVPRQRVDAGTLELFVTLVDTEGQPFALGGGADDPLLIVIDPHPAPPLPPGPDHSAVSGFFEFVDFNRFYGNDYYFKAEADFMYRIGGILHSVRMGFGTLSGVGESIHNLDDLHLMPRQVGINYGYVEGELHFHRLVGLAARLLVGQTQSGAGGGAELKLRIGNEQGTNLMIGGAIVSDFGALAQLQLEWNVIKRWPMSVTVVATNQPVQTDLGVRLIYQVGWRARKWIAPTVRIGYDVRNINHGGLSLGMGLVMSW